MNSNTTAALHPGLPEIPERCRKLPVVRGFPVPYFVQWVNGEPEFRAMDHAKFERCTFEGLCWVCGEPLGVHKAFVIGPMCAINRISAEPPSHRECAEWSARACPFLSMPKAKRSERDMAGGIPFDERVKGECHLERNPGVAMVWVTRSYELIRAPGASASGYLLAVGEPEEVLFFSEGRRATVEEIMHSIDTGLPALEAAAEKEATAWDRAAALVEIRKKYEETKLLVAKVA